MLRLVRNIFNSIYSRIYNPAPPRIPKSSTSIYGTMLTAIEDGDDENLIYLILKYGRIPKYTELRARLILHEKYDVLDIIAENGFGFEESDLGYCVFLYTAEFLELYLRKKGPWSARVEQTLISFDDPHIIQSAIDNGYVFTNFVYAAGIYSGECFKLLHKTYAFALTPEIITAAAKYSTHILKYIEECGTNIHAAEYASAAIENGNIDTLKLIGVWDGSHLQLAVNGDNPKILRFLLTEIPMRGINVDCAHNLEIVWELTRYGVIPTQNTLLHALKLKRTYLSLYLLDFVKPLASHLQLATYDPFLFSCMLKSLKKEEPANCASYTPIPAQNNY
jgi:hypothetical protein